MRFLLLLKQKSLTTTDMKTKNRETLITVLVMVILMVIGNRLFNHVNPWIGLIVIALAPIYGLFKINQYINNSKKR